MREGWRLISVVFERYQGPCSLADESSTDSIACSRLSDALMSASKYNDKGLVVLAATNPPRLFRCYFSDVCCDPCWPK